MNWVWLGIVAVSGAFVAYTYVGYPLLLKVLAMVRPRTAHRSPRGEWPTISITVPAFLRYNQVRSQVCISTVLKVGNRYGGSSITKGVDSPLRIVDLSNLADISAKTQERTVTANIMEPSLRLKKASMSIA